VIKPNFLNNWSGQLRPI